MKRPSRVAILDLLPLDMPAHQSLRPELSRLSDEALLEAVESPTRGDFLLINTRSGMLFDGNGRAYELQRRAASEGSAISPDRTVPVQYYTPDYSAFPDMEP